MKYLLIIMCVVFSPENLFSQLDDCRCDYDDTDQAMLEEKLVCIVKPTTAIGLPKNDLYGQWRFGTIILNNGEVISRKLIRYDGLTDQLILDSQKPSIKLEVERHSVQGFDIESYIPGLILHFRRVEVQDRNTKLPRDIFLQILITGKNSLYAYRKIVQTLEINKTAIDYSYYILREDGSMVNLARFTHRSFLKLFPDEVEAFRTALKRQHIRVRNEEQAILAIALINTL